MRGVIDALKTDVYDSADTVNMEGAKAWTQSNTTRLEQLCMTGTFGNSFYASTKDLVDGAVEAFKEADATALAQAIIKGRNKGFIRSANILGLIFLSQKDSKIFKETFPHVVITGNDLEDFINMCREIRGFGRAIKTAINTYLANVNQYYAIKYRRQLADAMRLARPSGGGSLFKYISSYYTDTKLPEDMEQVMAFEKAKKYLSEGDQKKAAKLIVDHRLDVGALLGVGNLDGVWGELASQMGVMMFIKYLDKLDREGALTDELIKSKITVDNLKRAKVFPFRLYIAYQNISNMRVKNHLAKILDDYTLEYDWSSFKGSWAICPDVSGSMTWESYNNTKPSLIAGLFTGFLYKGIEDTCVIPWDTDARTYDHPKGDSVITHISNIEHCGGGGTYMETPVNYLNAKKIKADNVVFITDSMEWGKGWLSAWVDYKKRNPQAKAFLIRIDPYKTQCFNDAVAQKHGIYQIFGWSDNVVKYIEACV